MSFDFWKLQVVTNKTEFTTSSVSGYQAATTKESVQGGGRPIFLINLLCFFFDK